MLKILFRLGILKINLYISVIPILYLNNTTKGEILSPMFGIKYTYLYNIGVRTINKTN